MNKAFFVTGTDTNVGKTWASVALMHWWRQQGLSVAAMKPVAAGCEWLDGRWVNQDGLLLQAAASEALPYEQINPYTFELAVSPHIACGPVDVDVPMLKRQMADWTQRYQRVLVEGAGGWLSPLDGQLSNQSLAQALELPVILVVGMRLGCLNHAALTMQSIQSSGLRCAGWLAVALEPHMDGFLSNLNYLAQSLSAPYIGCLGYMSQLESETLLDHFQIKIWEF